MTTSIRLKRSNTSGNLPTLQEGELALQLADRRVLTANSTDVFDAFQNTTANLSLTGTTITLTVGNTSVNLSINSTSISIANSSSQTRLALPTANQVSSVDTFLHANGSWVSLSNATPVTQVTGNTTGTSVQLIDSLLKSNFVASDYFIYVSDNLANNRLTTNLSVINKNSAIDADFNEYGRLESNSNMGTFTVNANATHLLLFFTPVSSNTFYTFTRTSLFTTNTNNTVVSTTTGTTPQIIDSWLKLNNRSCRYFIYTQDNISNNFMSTNLLVLNIESNIDANFTEYGRLESNTTMGTFVANANSTHILLYFTPVSTSTTYFITKVNV